MKLTKRLILILIVLIFCIGCDQATKSIAVSHLPALKTFSYLGDTLRLQLTYNRGAFLGMGH
jgi:signal peptidase II